MNGDEAVGGTTTVPSQNDTEALAAAVGIVVDDDTPLDTAETISLCDRQRWELDPASAIDISSQFYALNGKRLDPFSSSDASLVGR